MANTGAATDQQMQITKADIRATCHLIIISMCKTFNPREGTQSTQLTTIEAMLEFISTDKLSLAHSEPDVWADIARFSVAVEAEKKKLGGKLWPYYRIMEPGDQSLSVVNFKFLACAAIAYKKTFGDSAFKNVADPRATGVPKRIIEGARVIDNREIRSSDQADILERLTEEQRVGASLLKLDVTKAIGSRRARIDAAGGSNDNLMAILRDAFNQTRGNQ